MWYTDEAKGFGMCSLVNTLLCFRKAINRDDGELGAEAQTQIWKNMLTSDEIGSNVLNLEPGTNKRVSRYTSTDFTSSLWSSSNHPWPANALATRMAVFHVGYETGDADGNNSQRSKARQAEDATLKSITYKQTSDMVHDNTIIQYLEVVWANLVKTKYLPEPNTSFGSILTDIILTQHNQFGWEPRVRDILKKRQTSAVFYQAIFDASIGICGPDPTVPFHPMHFYDMVRLMNVSTDVVLTSISCSPEANNILLMDLMEGLVKLISAVYIADPSKVQLSEDGCRIHLIGFFDKLLSENFKLKNIMTDIGNNRTQNNITEDTLVAYGCKYVYEELMRKYLKYSKDNLIQFATIAEYTQTKSKPLKASFSQSINNEEKFWLSEDEEKLYLDNGAGDDDDDDDDDESTSSHENQKRKADRSVPAARMAPPPRHAPPGARPPLLQTATDATIQYNLFDMFPGGLSKDFIIHMSVFIPLIQNKLDFIVKQILPPNMFSEHVLLKQICFIVQLIAYF
jgi:hypothetical protein